MICRYHDNNYTANYIIEWVGFKNGSDSLYAYGHSKATVAKLGPGIGNRPYYNQPALFSTQPNDCLQ